MYLDQLEVTVRATGTITGDDEFRVDATTMDRLVDIYRSSGGLTGGGA